ncbi:hypothetical protein HRJ35_15705 [Shewanella oneidensis MR-1]|nr:hypothetical protein HRJ35_15705 [Shewanella oneidensis MR-1]
MGIMFPLLASSSPISNQTVLGTQSSQTFAKISPEMPIDDKNNPNSVYAFGSYLGTGIYRAAEQNATIVSIPLVFDFLKEESSQTWLRLPLSFGFFDYLAKDITDGELPSSVGTMTMTPGIEHHWQATINTRMEAYLDVGFGTNFDTDTNVAILASGISTLYDFTLAGEDSVWVSRLRFAGYSEQVGELTDQFAVLQTGVDIGLSPRWQWLNIQMQPRLFAVGYWYFNELDFSQDAEDETIVSGSYEFGATLAFSKPLGGDLLGVDRIGISYRTGDGLNIWRLLFSFPI